MLSEPSWVTVITWYGGGVGYCTNLGPRNLTQLWIDMGLTQLEKTYIEQPYVVLDDVVCICVCIKHLTGYFIGILGIEYNGSC